MIAYRHLMKKEKKKEGKAEVREFLWCVVGASPHLG